MKIEHVAFNVPDPLAMARWYVEHLGLTVKRRLVEPPYTHFLVDDSGASMVELYKQDAPIPNYRETHVMSLHLAIVSHDVRRDVDRLTNAGAALDGDVLDLPSGDCFAMVRDPWGFTIQLISRQEPMM